MSLAPKKRYFEDPSDIVPLTFSLDAASDPSSLLPSLRALLSELTGETPSGPPLVVSGGLSNQLFLVPTFRRRLLIRLQHQTDDAEHRLAARLSSLGFGPKYYGRFRNGRVEEYYENTTTLDPADLLGDEWGAAVATTMAAFHRLPLPTSGEEAQFSRVDARIIRASLTSARYALEFEWAWTRSRLLRAPAGSAAREAGVRFARATVPCHHDVQSRNLLRAQSIDGEAPRTLRLIDYEYAGHDRRALDLANTFCECCDMNELKPRYAEEYPDDRRGVDFCREYVKKADPEVYRTLVSDEDALTEYGSVFLKAVVEDVHRHSLVSHLGWAAWALCRSEDGNVEYDFLEYARLRMEGYYWMKERIIRDKLF